MTEWAELTSIRHTMRLWIRFVLSCCSTSHRSDSSSSRFYKQNNSVQLFLTRFDWEFFSFTSLQKFCDCCEYQIHFLLYTLRQNIETFFLYYFWGLVLEYCTILMKWRSLFWIFFICHIFNSLFPFVIKCQTHVSF